MSAPVAYALLVLLVICALAAVFTTDLLAAVAILGCYSFFLAVFWALVGAIDVSFTEAVVGAGISTVFLLVALLRTGRHTEPPPRGRFFAGALVFMAALGLLMGWIALDFPAVGDLSAPANAYLSTDYLKRTVEDMQTLNAVTSILADYRGFDTMIEETVILTAGVACFLLMRRRKS